MKISNIQKIALWAALYFLAAGASWAQNPGMDSILPTDVLLENLPWLGDDGQVASKGLFDFEDVRGTGQKDLIGTGQKDLIFVYRQSAPVSELDKPHDQTLVVCFYDKKQSRYVKSFQDEGGTLEWVKVVKGEKTGPPFLLFERNDLKGNQELKGYRYENGGLKQVLGATAPKVYARLVEGSRGLEVWGSSKGFPESQKTAEHVFSWDAAKDRFAEAGPAAGGLAGWSGPSIAVPVAQVPQPPTRHQQVAAVAHHPSPNGWWDEPLDPQASSARLNTQMVPEFIQKGQIAVLGQKAKSFFTELRKKKVPGRTINGMKSSYYAAVASALLQRGSKKDAAYYLKVALAFQGDNPDALALKAKMAP